VPESGTRRNYIVSTYHTVILECQAADRRAALQWAKTNLRRLRFESILVTADRPAEVSLVDEPFPVLKKGKSLWSIPIALVSKLQVKATTAEHAAALAQAAGEKVIAWRGPCQFAVVLNDSRDIEVRDAADLSVDQSEDDKLSEDSSSSSPQGM
jgi:hypothetical protein